MGLVTQAVRKAKQEACGQQIAEAAESSAGMSPPTHRSLLADCAHLPPTWHVLIVHTTRLLVLHSGLTAINDVPTLPNRSSLAASPLETMPLKTIPPPSRLLHAAHYSPQPLPRTATHQWYTLLTTRYCSQGAREHVAGLGCGDRSNWTMLTCHACHTADIPARQVVVETGSGSITAAIKAMCRRRCTKEE